MPTYKVMVSGEVDADTPMEAWEAVLNGDWHAGDHWILLDDTELGPERPDPQTPPQ